MLFHHEGGVEVGDVDAKAQKLMVPVDGKLTEDLVKEQLLTQVPDDKKEYGNLFLKLSLLFKDIYMSLFKYLSIKQMVGSLSSSQ